MALAGERRGAFGEEVPPSLKEKYGKMFAVGVALGGNLPGD